MLDYCYKAYELGIKKQVVDVAINGSGNRDTARVLTISKNTVIATLKKENSIIHVNSKFQSGVSEKAAKVSLVRVCEKSELDEQWSFVDKKSIPRWLWYAVDHAANTILAFVFGKREVFVFKELNTLQDL